jgi:hypothetical protein
MAFLSGVFYLVVRKFVHANESNSLATGRVLLAGQALWNETDEVGAAMSVGS